MTTPIIVFALYFAVVFAIGWVSMRATRDEADYWIAGGKLGWLVGGATMAATHTSAGTFIGTIGVMYTAGWSFGWLVLSIPLGYWFMTAVLAPRFTRVRELTLPAFLEARYYGRAPRALGACIILIAYIVYIQAQIVAGGIIANVAFGIPPTWGMIGFTAILLAYTVLGGMIAVVWTDFFQLGVMVLGVLAALPIAVNQVGGTGELFRLVQAANPDTFTWNAFPPSLLFTMGLSFMLGSVAGPEKLTRLYAMKDMRTIRRATLLTIVTVCGMNLTVFLLSLVSIVMFPALPTGDLAMPMIATAVLPPILGSIMLAAVTAAMMSTVDSLLIVAGSALSLDIYRTLIDPGVSPRRRMWIDRAGIALVGIMPVILLLSGVGEGELVQFIVLLFTGLMASSFFVPVVLGVYWRRATRQGALAAMLGGVTMTLLWEAFGPTAIDPVLPGFIASLSLMLLVSLSTPRPPASALSPYFPA
ncbi:MAG: sodium:solute symporter family transporter [Longimicrobiales bacterium]